MFLTKVGFEIENIYILEYSFFIMFSLIYSRFNYVVLPEQDKLKAELESDLLSEGRYEKE